VILSDDALRVRMGIWFHVEVPRSSIKGAGRYRDVWWAIGAHTDFNGGWLVNGSSKGIVFLDIDPRQPGRGIGFRTSVRRLGLGLEDPDGFLAALGAPPETFP